MYDIQHCFICHPSDSTVSVDAGIVTQDSCDCGIGCQSDALTTRLDLIQFILALVIETIINFCKYITIFRTLRRQKKCEYCNINVHINSINITIQMLLCCGGRRGWRGGSGFSLEEIILKHDIYL
jgi:hypothetical protein